MSAIFIYIYTCFLYANICLLFVFVQALAESAVGNGGRGAHEGGGKQSQVPLAWLDLPRENPEDSYGPSFFGSQMFSEFWFYASKSYIHPFFCQA